MNILLYAEVNLLCLAILTVIAIGMQNGERSRRRSFFESSVWCSILAGFCDLLWNMGQTSHLTISQANAYAMNFVYFLGLSGAAFFMFLYFEHPVQSWVLKNRLTMAAAALPVSALGIVMADLLIYIHSLQQMMSTDVLTGISNRRELLRVLAEQTDALNRENHLYFLFIDIDSFKQINDIYGHNEGDRVLRLVASVLKHICLETNGYCGRYGGDEFAVLQRMDSEEEIAAFRKKICDAVEKKSKAEALAYTVSVSIGCAEYTGEGMALHELISQADSNMYHRKNHKRSLSI